jgi:uncharacterized protein (DUF4415 family)
MTNEDNITKQWLDPDDAPELTTDWFSSADAAFDSQPVARRGRPKAADPKQLVSLRLDREVLELLRAQGSGWQTKVNEELRKVVGLS